MLTGSGLYTLASGLVAPAKCAATKAALDQQPTELGLPRRGQHLSRQIDMHRFWQAQFCKGKNALGKISDADAGPQIKIVHATWLCPTAINKLN